jgi:hypothetical protein
LSEGFHVLKYLLCTVLHNIGVFGECLKFCRAAELEEGGIRERNNRGPAMKFSPWFTAIANAFFIFLLPRG